MNECFVCERIKQIRQGVNPYFVKELSTGYVVIGDNQFYKGLTFFISKIHKSELHDLDKKFRDKFLSEMADVAEAVYKAFKPQKINCELLGNKYKHLHWWIIPRHFDDPNPTKPIWVLDKSVNFGDNTKPSTKEIDALKILLSKEL